MEEPPITHEPPAAVLDDMDDGAKKRAPGKARKAWSIVALALTALVVLSCLLDLESLEEEWVFVSRLGVIGVLGFWLAQGGGHGLVRLGVAGVVLVLLSVTIPDDGLEAMVALALYTASATACAYVMGMLVSLIWRQPQERRKFSIGHLLVITAIVGLLVVGLQQVLLQDMGEVPVRELVFIFLMFGFLGLNLCVVCLPLLAFGRRGFWAITVASAVVVVVLPFVVGGLEAMLNDGGAGLDDLWRILWTMAFLVALIAYPLEFGLRGFGLSLVAGKKGAGLFSVSPTQEGRSGLATEKSPDPFLPIATETERPQEDGSL